MIDIHAHILNGVDDGAQDEETSLSLIKLAAEKGTTDLFCTPHVIEAGRGLTWQDITAKTQELQEKATAQGIKIRLHPGAELEMNIDLMQMLQKGHSDYCLGGSRYVLIELPAYGIPNHLEDIIYFLEINDFIPILAHPERHEKFMANHDLILRLLQRGILLQCNAGSIIGFFGEKIKDNVELLLKNKAVSFIGSDAHRTHGRNTNLEAAEQELIKLVGEKQTETIVNANAYYILTNEPFMPDAPTAIQPLKRGFWQTLKKLTKGNK